MDTLKRFLNWLREPWLTESRALADLRRRFTGTPRIVTTNAGSVKVYSDKCLMTHRPTLKQAMDRVRKYCPIR